jgi:hypothetical protein
MIEARMGSSDDIDLDLSPVAGAVRGAVGGVGGADAVASAAPIEAGSATEAVEAALATSEAIAEALATGALDPVAAQQLLIDQVLAEIPGLAPERIEELRGELATLLDGDPALTSLLGS